MNAKTEMELERLTANAAMHREDLLLTGLKKSQKILALICLLLHPLIKLMN